MMQGGSQSREVPVRHQHNSRTRHLTFILPLLALLVVGCVQVNVVDQPAAATEQAAAAKELVIGQEHDLAILAVEFDPPLETLKVPPEKNEATLQVAVENKGYRKEGNVTVTVQLYGAESDEPISEQTQTLEAIAAGEIKVLKFQSPLPRSYASHYRLEVNVSAVAGETYRLNNHKTFDIRVSSPR